MNTVSVNSRLVGNILDCSYSQSFHHSCPSLRYDQAVVHKLNTDLSKGNVFLFVILFTETSECVDDFMCIMHPTGISYVMLLCFMTVVALCTSE